MGRGVIRFVDLILVQAGELDSHCLFNTCQLFVFMTTNFTSVRRPFLKRGHFRYWAVACKNSPYSKLFSGVLGIGLSKGQQVEITDLRHLAKASLGFCPALGWIILWENGLRCCHIVALSQFAYPVQTAREPVPFCIDLFGRSCGPWPSDSSYAECV